MRLIDTNILVHAVDEESPLMQRARDVLNYYAGAGEAAVALQSVLEMYSALTKSMDLKKARLAAERVLEGSGFKKVHSDKEDFLNALALAEKHSLRRSDVFDALLAATAKRNGIDTILTENPKHFERLGIKVETLATATLSEEF
jgi:predicted nucleic acid-binding protein